MIRAFCFIFFCCKWWKYDDKYANLLLACYSRLYGRITEFSISMQLKPLSEECESVARSLTLVRGLPSLCNHGTDHGILVCACVWVFKEVLSHPGTHPSIFFRSESVFWESFTPCARSRESGWRWLQYSRSNRQWLSHGCPVTLMTLPWRFVTQWVNWPEVWITLRG